MTFLTSRAVFFSFLSLLNLVHCLKDQRPNIVVLLADDLGIGDIGCFGNTSIPTPNIDKLCTQGAKLTHHVAAAAFCTPSRAALLTGRYPVRMGLSGDQSTPPVIVYVSAKTGLPETEQTWAKHLQQTGYVTQAVGKWHLGWDKSTVGDNLHGPLNHGFDNFYGLPFTLVDGFERTDPFLTYSKFAAEDGGLLHSHATALILSFLTVLAVYSKDMGYYFFVLLIVIFLYIWFFVEHFTLHTENWWRRSYFMEKYLNSMLMENQNIIEQPIVLSTLMSRLTEFSVNFIKTQAINGSKPFALYHAFTSVHPPLTPGYRFRGKSSHGFYGDSVIELDDAVGQIMRALQETGADSNTVVYFTSDHGTDITIGPLGGSNGLYKGGKGMDSLEGGIRVPGIITWPNVIKPNSIIDVPTSLLDFTPTVHSIAARHDRRPKNLLDGLSLAPLFAGSSCQQREKEEKADESCSRPLPRPLEDRILRHYCGTSLHALRIRHEGEVFKVYRKYPKVNEEVGYCNGGFCSCFDVDDLETMRIFNLSQDPYEQLSPLPETSERFLALAAKATEEFGKADAEEHPPSQYLSKWDVMPRFWYQPCANFPFCKT